MPADHVAALGPLLWSLSNRERQMPDQVLSEPHHVSTADCEAGRNHVQAIRKRAAGSCVDYPIEGEV
jgi:hypothetical protein